MMFAPRDLRHLRHRFFDERRNGVVILVDRFTSLEVNIGVLRRTANDRMLGVERAAAERVHRIPVEDLCEIVVLHDLDLLNLVGRTESVKEVDERNASLDCNEMRDGSEIHNLLHARFGEHGNARLACRHDVLMVAENIQ